MGQICRTLHAADILLGSPHLLGAGSTGAVFYAVDENLHRPVASKVLRPSLGDAARGRFLAEARATAKLIDANVVTIFHVGVAQRLAYIVMQWLPGETLEERLQRQRQLSWEQASKKGRVKPLGFVRLGTSETRRPRVKRTKPTLILRINRHPLQRLLIMIERSVTSQLEIRPNK